MKLKLLPYLLLFCLLPSARSYAEQIKFKRYSVADGLSQSTIMAIEQDREGNMWFGTSDGLNRYDGYDFTVFRSSDNDTLSLNNDAVSSLFLDSSGTLWIGTAAGLSKYDRRNDRFANYTLPNARIQVFGIAEDVSQQQLILATDIGVVTFDKQKQELSVKSYLASIKAQALCRYKDGILIGTSNGIYNYSLSYGTIVRILPNLDRLDIANIVYQEGVGCWIATFGDGLYKTDTDLQVVRHYNVANSASLGLHSDYLRVLKMDASNNRLWIGTFNGLFVYDIATDRFQTYKYSHEDDTSLSHDSIRSIFIDSQNGVWLGTYYGGLSYYHPLAFRFGQMQYSAQRNSIGDNTVSCIVEERPSGNLWIGTNDSGVDYYDRRTDTFTHYRARAGGLRSNNIKCILPDGRGNIYIGTHSGGLSRMNVRSRTIENFTVNSDIPINNSCYSLLDGGDGTLWVGTLDGLLLFDKSSGRFSVHPAAEAMPQLSALVINTLYADSRQRVWIGTSAGLFSYDRPSGRVRRFEDMCLTTDGRRISVQVSAVMEDSAGNIWIGSNHGLFRYYPASATFANFTVDDGLPNNSVYGILEDDSGRLWISSNGELCRFNPHDRTIRTYSAADGVGNHQFNFYSYCKASDGTFYFGGLNGITSFKPDLLQDNPYAPMARIVDFTIFNRPVQPSDRVRYSFDADGGKTGVRFSAKDNLFGIKFVVTNPIAGDNNEFSYTLEGFDNQWYTTQRREVTYSNLSPGTYVFRVKAANNDGKWSDGAASFTIRIMPRWYQTVWAKIFYCLLLAAAVWFAWKFMRNRQEMKMQLFRERLEKNKISELSQEKIRFYINLSHELRTPLTLILSPLQEIRDYGVVDKYVETRFNYIYRNANRLLHIVNQILDYRKAESGIVELKITPSNVENIVADIFAMFEDAAQNRDMDYIFNSELGATEYPIDKLFIERILINLLSNAFKFTPDGGMIKVSLRAEDGKLFLSVRDSGKGMSAEDLPKAFDRFYQVDDNRQGSGLGLSIVKRLVELHHGGVDAVSRVGEGTELTVWLPAEMSAYSPDEIVGRDERLEPKTADASYFVEESNAFVSDENAMPGREDTAPVKTDSETHRRETILIVEDDNDIKHYLGENFRRRYDIRTASDGVEALALMKDSLPDVVITDLMMPRMDGLKLCQSIKQNLRTSHIPVIIITAKESMQDQINGIEAGADDYMTKPFSVSILVAKVNNLLKSKYRLQHYYSSAEEIDPDKVTLNSVDGQFLKKAIKVVEDNIDNIDFSSNDFARELCMSRSNLHLKLTSITGESSTRFIRKIRFNYACKLLAEGKYSVAEISTMVGFGTPSYFATSFKKYMGCLPTEYMKKRSL